MLSPLEVAWFAGLFEADGSFGFGGKEKQRLYFGIQMTDLDVLEKVKQSVGGEVYGPYNKNEGKGYNVKPMYAWSLNPQNEVWNLIEAVYPYLGQRRRNTIDAARNRKDNFVDKRFKVSA